MVFNAFWRGVALVCGLGVLPACAQTGLQATPHAPAGPVALQELAGRYIVVFQPEVADPQAAAQALVRLIPGLRLHQVYTHALKGFSASVPASALEALRRHPQVQSIEPDQPMQAYPVPSIPRP